MRLASQRSQQLLDIASELLDSEGPHALSLRRLADAVGTSTQSVYTEFGGKPGLADALFRLGYQRLADHIDSLELPQNPIERIVALGHAYRHVARTHPAHYELMTSHPIAEYQPPTESLAFAVSTMRPLRDAIASATASGAIAGDPTSLARDLWAAGHGYVSLEINGLIEVSDDDFDRYLRRQIHDWVNTNQP